MGHTSRPQSPAFTHANSQEAPVSEALAPPDTILIRWAEELLLCDAWNTSGTKLRTPPSLIHEAITHFQLPKEVADYRLAVHERVDGKPAMLFLGLSALRFVENGRVLELVDLNDQKLFPAQAGNKPISSLSDILDEESWQTAQDTIQKDHQSSDLSTTSSPSIQSQHSHQVAATPRDSPLHSPLPYGAPLMTRRASSGQSLCDPPLITSRKSSCTLVEKAERKDDSTYIYVHPTFGAIFAHLNHKTPRLTEDLQGRISQLKSGQSSPANSASPRDSTPLEAPRSGPTYDFTEPLTQGRHSGQEYPSSSRRTSRSEHIDLSKQTRSPEYASPRMPSRESSRPSSSRPSSARPTLHIQSYAANLAHETVQRALSDRDRSRRRGSAELKSLPDEDPWLGSHGSQTWRKTYPPGQAGSSSERSQSARSRPTTMPSYDRRPSDSSLVITSMTSTLPRPTLMPRSQSSATMDGTFRREHGRHRSEA